MRTHLALLHTHLLRHHRRHGLQQRCGRQQVAALRASNPTSGGRRTSTRSPDTNELVGEVRYQPAGTLSDVL